jgi:hypothetical protein
MLNAALRQLCSSFAICMRVLRRPLLKLQLLLQLLPKMLHFPSSACKKCCSYVGAFKHTSHAFVLSPATATSLLPQPQHACCCSKLESCHLAERAQAR